MKHNIDYLITGGSGLIGKAFIRSLPEDVGVVVLSRQDPKEVVKKIGRKVEVISSFDQVPVKSSIRFCLNLSGEPIVDKPWTRLRKQVLRDSRIGVTQELASLSRSLAQPFDVLVSGSAIGFYPASMREKFDEDSVNGSGFSAQLCSDWEKAAADVRAKRACLLRTGIVLAGDGGMLGKLKLSFSFGLGACMGDGEQMMSWVHIQDAVAIIHLLFSSENAIGPVNMCTNAAVSNREFSNALAKALHKPRFLTMPTFAVNLIFGERAGLLLDSQTIIPKRLNELGYSFKYRDINEALSAVYS